MKDVVPAVRSTPKTAKFKEYPKATTIPEDKETNSSKKEKPFATARHGPKPAVRNYLPPPIEEEVKPRSKKKSGWVDKDGNPLPDAPPRKKSIINIIEEKEAEEEKKAKKKAQAKEKRKRTVEVKKKKKTEEKIEFGLLRKLVLSPHNTTAWLTSPQRKALAPLRNIPSYSLWTSRNLSRLNSKQSSKMEKPPAPRVLNTILSKISMTWFMDLRKQGTTKAILRPILSTSAIHLKLVTVKFDQMDLLQH